LPPTPTTPWISAVVERLDDCTRLRDRRAGWGERVIDDRHLRGMDRHLAGKAVALGSAHSAASASRSRKSTKTVSIAAAWAAFAARIVIARAWRKTSV
jgi:hypothetical protein